MGFSNVYVLIVYILSVKIVKMKFFTFIPNSFQLLDACAKNATESVLSAIRTYGRALWFVSVTNATTVLTRVDVLFAVDRVYPMLITARSVPFKRKM